MRICVQKLSAFGVGLLIGTTFTVGFGVGVFVGLGVTVGVGLGVGVAVGRGVNCMTVWVGETIWLFVVAVVLLLLLLHSG